MDIFEEDEKQREEELEQWWKDNWKSILGGVVLAIVLIIAVYMYRDYMTQKRQDNATAFYTTVMDVNNEDPKVEAVTKSFIQNHNDVYGELAASSLAKSYISAKKYEEAFTVLKDAIGKGNDDILDNILRIRAARLAIVLKKYSDAESLLSDTKDESFKAAVLEVRGDSAVAQGKTQEAQKFYEEAKKVLDANNSENPMLKMKYENLLSTDGVKANKSIAVSESAKTEEKASEPAKVEEKASEPAKAEEKASEPAKVEEKASEPAKAEEKASEPAKVEEKASEPAKAEEKASEPAKAEEKASEPAKTEEKAPEASK